MLSSYFNITVKINSRHNKKNGNSRYFHNFLLFVSRLKKHFEVINWIRLYSHGINSLNHPHATITCLKNGSFYFVMTNTNINVEV